MQWYCLRLKIKEHQVLGRFSGGGDLTWLLIQAFLGYCWCGSRPLQCGEYCNKVTQVFGFSSAYKGYVNTIALSQERGTYLNLKILLKKHCHLRFYGVWSQITLTNTMIKKSLKCENYQIMTDIKWANVVGKMVPIDLLADGLPHAFNF